jgi:hypothetical protein
VLATSVACGSGGVCHRSTLTHDNARRPALPYLLSDM